MIKLPKAEIRVERVDRREWDFSVVAPEEMCACCHFEYGRESTFILEQLNSFPAQKDPDDPRSRALNNSRLVYALPGCPIGTRNFDLPWLATDPKWRAKFCEMLASSWDGLGYARILKQTP